MIKINFFLQVWKLSLSFGVSTSLVSIWSWYWYDISLESVPVWYQFGSVLALYQFGTELFFTWKSELIISKESNLKLAFWILFSTTHKSQQFNLVFRHSIISKNLPFGWESLLKDDSLEEESNAWLAILPEKESRAENWRRRMRSDRQSRRKSV
jgi:hypothetical protein